MVIRLRSTKEDSTDDLADHSRLSAPQGDPAANQAHR
jgi:hypothetical protein